MKARVKATGEIIEVVRSTGIYDEHNEKIYNWYEVETLDSFDKDYWTRLKHQYAGMIVQGMVEHNGINFLNDAILNVAVQKTHALVEKLKEKEEK